MTYKNFIKLFFALFIPLASMAQYGISDGKIKPKVQQRVGVSADSSLIVMLNDRSYRELFGNVIIKNKDGILYANYAKQDVMANTFDAYGKVRILQGDTVSIVGDTVFYDANARFARITGKDTQLKDKKVTLNTRRIEYDMRRKKIFYPEYGKIVDAEQTLTSQSGNYSTRTKVFNFRNKVDIVAPKYTLQSDSLDYDANGKVAYFKAFTTIKSDDGLVFANGGTYNTETRQSNFKGRSWFDSKDYLISGDTLDFNGASESGVARGNVELISKKNPERDKVVIRGQKAIRDAERGILEVFGNPILINMKSEDTLYIRADTLRSIENPKDSTDRKLIANGNARVFKNDLQTLSDSLVYSSKDSVMKFFRDPIIWSANNQLEADSITVVLIQNKAKKVQLVGKSFVIASDSILNFNQIKGRKIDVNFDDSTNIENVYVDGNCESIYFALDEKNKIVGLNRVECGKMTMRFKKAQVKKITFNGKPDSQFFPPETISSKRYRLEGFEWREADKPTKEAIIRGDVKTKKPIVKKPAEEEEEQ